MAALKPIRQEKSLLKKDIKSMEEGTLGLSEAEKSQLTDKALRGAERASQHAVREAQRLAMATQGPAGPFMGQAAAHTRDLVKQAQEQAAAASSEAAAVSRDLAERRAEKTRERISQEAARRRQQPKKIAGTLGTAFQVADQVSQNPYVRQALETIGIKLKDKADLAEKEEVKVTEAGETPANVLSSTAKGAASGLAAGGPVGAVVGGGVGLVSGLARKARDKKRQEAENNKQSQAQVARDEAEARPEARPEAQQPTTRTIDRKLQEAFLNADTPQQKAIARALGMTVDQVNEFIESERALGGKIQQQFVQPVASSLGFGG